MGIPVEVMNLDHMDEGPEIQVQFCFILSVLKTCSDADSSSIWLHFVPGGSCCSCSP